MPTVDTVTRVMDWLDSTVCPLVRLKLPDDSDQDSDYPFRTVHPAVLGMYWPTSREQLPPGVHDVQPGILVQVVEGTETFSDHLTRTRIRLHLSAWNPGHHGPDTWVPKAEVGENGLRFERVERKIFRPGYDEGWRDAWNFLDTVRREVRNAPSFGRASLDRTEPVTFGPYAQQGAIIDLYPYWFCWLEFQLVEPESPPVEYAALDSLL